MQRIYIIEDQLLHQKFIEETIGEFIQHSGISAEIVPINSINSFIKAIPALDITDVDIFFIDINLKNQYTGIDIAEWLRRANPFCKIIFITNYTDQSMAIVTRNIIPFDYIHKNSNLAEVRKKIHVTLKKLFFTLQINAEEILLLSIQNEKQVFALPYINYIQTIKEQTVDKVLIYS
ncbi:response regulator receiver domain protein, partial [Enterococcus faecalis 13-SD-W-01]